MSAPSELPIRAVDRLSDLAARPHGQSQRFRLGGGLKRRLYILVGCISSLIILIYLGTRPGTWSTDEYQGWRPPEDSDLDAVGGAGPKTIYMGKAGEVCREGEGQMRYDAMMTEAQVRAMVARTKGYYARDWSLGLGWSQMRFIIETALFHAMLLNRTLILPTFVYARDCEFEHGACAAFAEQVGPEDSEGWSLLKHRTGWRVPIDVFIDIPNLRQTHPVLLMDEFLTLHSLPYNLEPSSGSFPRTLPSLLASIDPDRPPISLSTIPNNQYDTPSTLRVDKLIAPPTVSLFSGGDPELGEKIRKRLRGYTNGEAGAMDYEDARSVLAGGPIDVRKDEVFEKALEQAGMAVVWSFRNTLGMEFVKSVAEPVRQVVFRSAMRGFVEDFGSDSADILLLEGEIHLNRKPAALRFTSKRAQDTFLRAAIYALRPPKPILQLAGRLDERMRERNGGRMWLGGHMRRGDFVQLGWVMESTLQRHLDRIKERLQKGIQAVQLVRMSREVQTYAVPDVVPNQDILTMSPPLEHDGFFLATDERDPTNLAYLRSNGAVLVQDLLQPEDRRLVGQWLMLKDVLAVVEQATLAKAAYYYGHAMSAFGGFVMDMRAGEGRDVRTVLID